MQLVQRYSCFCLVLCHTNTPLVEPLSTSLFFRALHPPSPFIWSFILQTACARGHSCFAAFVSAQKRLKHMALELLSREISGPCDAAGVEARCYWNGSIGSYRHHQTTTDLLQYICESHYRLFRVRVWLRETAYFHTRAHKNGQVARSYALLSRSAQISSAQLSSAQLSSAQHDDVTYQ